MGIPPVRKSRLVRCSPADAFRTFTNGLSSWWPLATHAVHERGAAMVEVPEEVGGNIFETTDDGETATWGRVKIYQPPDCVAFTWHPGLDEALATQVEVRFDRAGNGTQFELVHGGWEARGDSGPSSRLGYDLGWDVVLTRFVAAAESNGAG